MKFTLPFLLALLALSVRAGVTVFTCDPIPYGTNYNLYVITTNGINSTSSQAYYP